MSNVLSEAKKQQVIALGRLGWPLRRIEQETGASRQIDVAKQWIVVLRKTIRSL
jgi:hypothetical protein